MHRLVVFLLSPLLACAAAAQAAEEPLSRQFDSEVLQVRLMPRTPQQVTAFYEGRGFPREMIELLKDTCFITVGIHNKSKDILWLELQNWRFQSAAGALTRLDRAYFREQWGRLDAPMPSQSTFRWTLLPEVLDFQPDEAEGGNLVLPRTGQPFSLEARFATGADKRGAPLTVRFDALRCAEDQPAP